MQLNWNAIAAIGQWAGAAATAIAVIVSLRIARKASRPTVKVIVGFYLPVLGDTLGEAIVRIKAVNTGNIPVHLNSSTFTLPREKKSFYMQNSASVLPKFLQPGESVEYNQDPRELAVGLKQHGLHGKVRVKVCYSDTADNTYSTKWKFDVDEWSKPATNSRKERPSNVPNPTPGK